MDYQVENCKLKRYVLFETAAARRVRTVRMKIETTSAAAIKAHVDLNYLEEGKYAYSYENLIEEAKEEDKPLLEKYRNNLKDFDYSVRGDDQAYQIKYTNIAGEEIVVEGNYSDDYH